MIVDDRYGYGDEKDPGQQYQGPPPGYEEEDVAVPLKTLDPR